MHGYRPTTSMHAEPRGVESRSAAGEGDMHRVRRHVPPSSEACRAHTRHASAHGGRAQASWVALGGDDPRTAYVAHPAVPDGAPHTVLAEAGESKHRRVRDAVVRADPFFDCRSRHISSVPGSGGQRRHRAHGRRTGNARGDLCRNGPAAPPPSAATAQQAITSEQVISGENRLLPRDRLIWRSLWRSLSALTLAARPWRSRLALALARIPGAHAWRSRRPLTPAARPGGSRPTRAPAGHAYASPRVSSSHASSNARSFQEL